VIDTLHFASRQVKRHTMYRGLDLPPFSGVSEMLGFLLSSPKRLDNAQNLSQTMTYTVVTVL
jgi:hypothetical protein